MEQSIKINPISAFLSCKCPNCKQGKMFKYPALHIKFSQMNSHCTNCGYNFEPETGFYWGAMYISYALSVGICVVLSVLLALFTEDLNINWYILTIVLAILISAPINFRYSRALMLWFLSKKEIFF